MYACLTHSINITLQIPTTVLTKDASSASKKILRTSTSRWLRNTFINVFKCMKERQVNYIPNNLCEDICSNPTMINMIKLIFENALLNKSADYFSNSACGWLLGGLSSLVTATAGPKPG